MSIVNRSINASGIVFCAFAAAAAGICPIDGYNVFEYSVSGYLADANLSVTGGDTSDSFYVLPGVNTGSDKRLSASFLLGAETGDALLNTFSTSKNYENRDHRTYAGGVYADDKQPWAIAARYRYVDTYTDRFDKLWGEYTAETGSEMANETEGVNYEAFAGGTWQGRTTRINASVNPYGRWHATPYYFSPLFEKGTAVRARADVSLKRLKIESVHEFSHTNWYYDHLRPVTYNDYQVRNDVSLYMGKKITAMLSGAYSKIIEPSGKVTAGIARTDSGSNAGISITAFSDREVGARLYGTLSMASNWRCSLLVARDYREKNRPYHFMENKRVVFYQPIANIRNIAAATVDWNDTIRFPLKLSGWFFHVDRPIREAVDEGNDTVTIRQVYAGGSVRSFAGVNGIADISWKRLTMTMRPGIVLPFGEEEDIHFFIGKTAEAQVAWQSGAVNPAVVSLKLVYNDQPSLTYLMVKSGGSFDRQKFRAPDHLSLYGSCRIPFIFAPTYSFINETAFCVYAGPIRLTGSGRYPFHPRGNDFGPEIYAGFEAAVR